MIETRELVGTHTGVRNLRTDYTINVERNLSVVLGTLTEGTKGQMQVVGRNEVWFLIHRMVIHTIGLL